MKFSNNEILVIIPAYNVEKFIGLNIEILKKQTFKNFKCIIWNDMSTDNTYNLISDLIKDDSRFKLINSKKHFGSPLESIISAITYANPSDNTIIINIDGDDWLSSTFVLEYIIGIYNQTNCWLTYGTYQVHPTGKIGTHHIIDIPDDIHDKNSYKSYPFVTSHLRTFKAFLFKHINYIDFIDKDVLYDGINKPYKMAGDLALMFPMLEMTPKDKIKRIEDVTYILNRENELNEANVNLEKQKEIEVRIRTKQKIYNKINDFVSVDILGPGAPGQIFNFGLANQMFQVATTLSYAHDNNKLAIFPQLRNTQIYGNYINNIFSKLNINGDLDFVKNHYEPQKFEYMKIPNMENVLLKGYFQSEKYFKHNKNLIKKYFEHTKDIKDNINKNRGIVWDLAISIHVRRGDYMNLSDFHPPQTIEYYKNALNFLKENVSYFDDCIICIFSDDIKWCKENFNFIENRVIFIENNPDYIDLYLMSKCKHHIIANSSFSWWGAWLSESEYEDGITIAPINWFGPKRADLNPKDIYCDNWVIMK